MVVSAERIKQLKIKAEESEKALAELAKQFEPLLSKNDPESRIKKLELVVQSFYHAWVSTTFSELEVTAKVLNVTDDLSTIVEKIVEQLSKITKDSGTSDKEIATIKQELEDQKKKIGETLQPLQQMIKQVEERQTKGNDIYG